MNSDNFKVFLEFFAAVERDQRISNTHLGIFASLLQYSLCGGFINPIKVFSYQIASMAKISETTYFRCIKELSDYGYLRYEPSYKHNKPSCIYFLAD
nr:hypothetical protein [Flavobacterium sp. Root420]